MATIEAIRPGMVLEELPGFVSEFPEIASDERWFVGPVTEPNERSPLPVIKAMPGKVLITSTEIDQAEETMVDKLAEIAPEKLCMIGVAKGALPLLKELGDKLRKKDPRYLEENIGKVITASSYGNGIESSGRVVTTGDPGDLKGKYVKVVEDIIDTGTTMRHLRYDLLRREPLAVEVVSLLLKEGTLMVEQSDLGENMIVGFRVPNLFVVGHGIDWAQLFRGERDIIGLDPQRAIDIPERSAA